jgi:hypothetical protein
VKTLLQFALVSALMAAAVGCDLQMFSAPSNGGASGAFCMQNSDCLSKWCALEPFTDPPTGKCG